MTKIGVLRRACPGLVVLSLAVAGCDHDPAAIADTWLEINATTTGAAFDADDYVVLMDGVEIERRLGPMDTLWVPGEPGQTIELELTDVAGNCQVDGAPRRSVTLAEGSTTSASFAVHCVAPAGIEYARLVFATGSCSVYLMFLMESCDLYTLPLDGSEGRLLTADGRSFQPAISADGSTIAFTRQSFDPGPLPRADLYAVDVDGGNPRRITDDGLSWDPSWSPEGTRIVYVHGVMYPDQLQIRRLDNEDVLSLQTSSMCEAPVWSPDGSRIAFSSWGGGSGGIYTVAPDGGEAVLVAARGHGAVWSPTSDRLAYEIDGSVYVIGLNDDAGTRLLPGSQLTPWTPTDWSPNGEWIALTRQTTRGQDVYLLHVDDGNLVRVTLNHRSNSAVFLPGT